MKEAVIKIEIKVVVEREECENDGFHTEEKSRDENGDKSLEIDLVKVAIIDLFATPSLKSLMGSLRRSFRMKTGTTILYELFFKSS